MRQQLKNHVVPGVDDPKLLGAYRRALRYLKRPTVTGVGIGLARRGGELAEIAVTFFVTAKLPHDRVPIKSMLPREIDGIPVDVVECQLRTHQQHGAMVGAKRISPGMVVGDGNHYGSIGMVAREVKTNAVCAITCAHVLSATTNGIVYQPPNASSQNTCGRLGPTLWNFNGDVAVIRLSRPGDNIIDGTGIQITTPRIPSEGELLRKRGFVSGPVSGRLSHFGVMNVTYADHPSAKISGFYIESDMPNKIISAPGDSGAVWYDPVSGAAVGIEVAGDAGNLSNSGNRAFACLASTAFELLGLALP